MAKENEAVLERIGTLLEKSLKRLDPACRLAEYGVWPIWNDLVGSTIARNAQPDKIRHGTLFVRVTSPIWLQQLQYMKEVISEKLNQKLGNDVVKNIFFFIGKLETDSRDAPQDAPKEIREPLHSASKAALMNDEQLSSLKDPDIRLAFEKLFARITKG
ncbi:MAG: DUF721 domain-containing protein [Deltaproteobacteria bacterium]|nr:DUF721 domain-containing protein [Deltaproteobacteria bacterium]